MLSYNTYLLIFRLYFLTLISIIICLFCIYEVYQLVVGKKELLFGKGLNKKQIEYYIKHKKAHNLIFIILIVIYMFFTIYLCVYSFPGIKQVITNDYDTFYCTASYDSGVHSTRVTTYQNVNCIKENGEEIRFDYSGPNLKKGYKIKVKYFDKIEIGEIIEVISSS